MIVRPIVLATVTVLIGTAGLATVAHAQAPPALVGTWRLVSSVLRDANGAEKPYWDDKPAGLIVYTPDGHVSAQVYDSRRPRLGVPWETATAEAARRAFVGLSTYFGTYVVDTQAHTVTHTVEGAMAPDWVGMKLVRRYRFLTPDTIELSVVPDAQLPATGLVLVWQRVR